MNTSISITRVSKREHAQKFEEAINGKSYMNFEVLVCPAGGEFEVIVVTSYTDDEAEAQGMLNYLMFCEIS